MATSSKGIQYIKNVGKSFGYAIVDVAKEYNPVITSITKDVKETSKELYQSVKSYKSTASDSEKDLIGQGKDAIGGLWKNLKDDFKSGNWYNKQREKEADDLLFKALGMDMSDLDVDFDDFNFDDDFDKDTELTVTQDVRNTQATILALDSTGQKIAGAVNEGTVASANYIVESNKQISKALYDLNRKGFNQVTEALMSVNTTTAGIGEAIGKPLTTHINNSQIFFTNTTQTLNQMAQSLERIVKNTTPAPASTGNYREMKGIGNLMSDGSISIDAYKQMVANNLKEYKGLADMLIGGVKNTGGAGSIAKTLSPMKWITTGIVSSIIPTVLKDSMKELNSSISDLLTGAIVKGQHAKTTGFLSTILKGLFLPDDNIKTSINTSLYNKGAVAWDGIARKALIEVIPTTLFKIYSAITGQPEARFDFNTGKFVSFKSIQQSKSERENRAAQDAGGKLRDDALSMAKTSALKAEIESFFFDAFIKADGDITNFSKLSPEAAKIMKDLVKSGKYNSTIGRIAKKRQDYSNDMRRMESSGDNIETNINNDSETAFGTYTRNISSSNKRKKKGERTKEETTKAIQTVNNANKSEEELKADNMSNAVKEASKYVTEHTDKAKTWVRKLMEKVLPKGMIDAFEKPINAIAQFIGKLTGGITEFLWGDKGVFTDLKKKLIDKFWDPLKQHLKSFWNATKKSLGNAGQSLGNAAMDIAGNLWYGKQKYSEKKAQTKAANDMRSYYDDDVYLGEGPDESGFAYGATNVPYTGLYALSEGELIIPSEFNPFFHGVTNKSSQRRNEQAIIREFMGYQGRHNGRSRRTRRIRKAASGEKAAAGGDASGPVSKEDTDTAFSLLNIINSMKNRASEAADALFGAHEDGKSIKDSIKDAFAKTELGKAKGNMGAGAILGAAGGLFLGSPILGAIVGTTIGYVSKSEKAKNWLFGEEKDGERQGGFFSKEFSNTLTKTIPGIGKGGALGAIGGLFLGSPILGAIAGSTIGYVSRSEKAKNWLFGEEKDGERQGGAIPKELQEKIKKAAPNMAVGAIAGLLAGPFGLAGNLIFGSGLGFLSTSDSVKTFLFGDKTKDGDKGLLGNLREKIFGNITEIFANLGNRLKGIGAHLLNHTKNLITGLFGKLKDMMNNKNSFLGKTVGRVVRFGGKVLDKTVGGVGRGLGRISTNLKTRNLRQGYDVFDKKAGRNLTAQERIDMRSQFGKRSGSEGTFGQFDAALAAIDSQAQMDELQSLLAGAQRGDMVGIKKLENWSKEHGVEGLVKNGKVDQNKLLNAKNLANTESKKRLKSAGDVALESIESGVSKIVRWLCGTDVNGKPIPDAEKKANEASKKINEFTETSKGKIHKTDADGNPLQYVEGKDGELELDMSDAGTKEAVENTKAKNKSLAALAGLMGGLGAKMSGFFGSIKDKLFGDGDKKPGILDKIKDFLFGDSESGFTLKSLLLKVGGVAAGALGLWTIANALGGKFDNFFAKLGELGIFKGNDTKSGFGDNTSTTITDANGNLVQVTQNENGEFVDAKGNVVENASNPQVVGSNNTLSSRLKKNFANGLIMGNGSVVTKGIKASISAISPKAGKALKTASSVIKEKGLKEATNVLVDATRTNLSKLCEKLPNILRKIPILGKKITDPELVADTLKSNLDKVVKSAGSKLTKIAGVVSNALAALKIVYVIGKGVDAWGNAESILGITEEATVGQRVIATLVAVVNALIPGIGDLIPNNVLVNIFMSIAPKIGIDVSELASQREQAQKEVEEYNKMMGTNYSIQEYNELGLTYDEETGEYEQGKARAGILTRAKNSIKSKFAENKAKKANLKATAASTLLEYNAENGTNLTEKQYYKLLKKESKQETKAQKALARQQKKEERKEARAEKKQARQEARLAKKAERKEKFENSDFSKALAFIKAETDRANTLLHTPGSDVKEFFKVNDMGEKNAFSGISKVIITAAKIPLILTAVIKKVFSNIKEGFGKFMDKIKTGFTNISNIGASAKEISKSGNLDALWNLDATDDEGNPLGGFYKVVATIDKVLYTIPTAIHFAGNKIKEAFTAISEKIKTGFANMNTLRENAKAKADEGDISGLWALNAADDEGNPLGGFYKAVNVGEKIAFTVPALFHLASNKIKDLFSPFIEGVKTNATTFNSAVATINSYADTGDMSKMSSIWEVEGIKEKGHLAGFFNFAIGVNKIGGAIKLVFEAIIGKIEGIINKVKDIGASVGEWFGDTVDTIKEGASNTWNNVKTGASNAWNNVKTGASNIAQAGWDKLTGWLGGGSGFVSQYDPRYSRYSIGSNSFADKGCGPAVASMVANSYGRNLSVGDAVRMSKGYQGSGGVSSDYFASALGSRGISTSYSNNPAQIAAHLMRGGSTVLLGSDPSNSSKAYSPFGPNNHYVMATGMDRRGNIIVNDPENRRPRKYNSSILNSTKLGILTGGASGISKDSDKCKSVWAFFKSQGLSDAATAGIMGNIWTESKFDSTNHSGDSGKAAGICQWHTYGSADSRWGALNALAKSRGRDWTDLETQLMFVLQEITGSQKGFFKTAKSNYGLSAGYSAEQFLQESDVATAAKWFAAAYERPKWSEKGMNGRINNAVEFYNLYSGKSYSYTPMTAVSYGSSDSLSGSIGKATGLSGVLSGIASIFSSVFGKMFGRNDSSSTAGYNTGIIDGGNQTYLNLSNTKANDKQKELVNKLASIQGKIRYDLGSVQDPDKGVASCASTVGWAYRKVLGVNGMSASSTKQAKDNRFTTIYTNDGSHLIDTSKLMPGDVMYYNWDRKNMPNDGTMKHTEMYIGNNQDFSHGGKDKTNPTGYGPVVKDVNDYRKRTLMMVRRYNDFMTNSDSASYDPINNAASGGVNRNGRQFAVMQASGSGLKPHAFVGGESALVSMKNKATDMVSNIASKIKSAGSRGEITPELMQQLLTAIIQILQSIADNTAPVGQIYTTLTKYNMSAANTTKTTAANTTNKTVTKPSEEVDIGFKNVVGQLAALAKG